jgi:hypothetical protein
MAQTEKNVFERLEELLNTLIRELETLNSAVYVTATETIAISEKLDTLIISVDNLAGQTTKVAAKLVEVPVVEKPVKVLAFSFEALHKETE